MDNFSHILLHFKAVDNSKVIQPVPDSFTQPFEPFKRSLNPCIFRAVRRIPHIHSPYYDCDEIYIYLFFPFHVIFSKGVINKHEAFI